MSCMCWLHQKNFKQLTVSPLRPHPCVNMCVCVCAHRNTHTQTLTFPPQNALPNCLSFSRSVSPSLRLCLCRLLLKPPSLPLALCWSAHGRLSIKARLLPSELPAVDLPAPGSNTPRQFDSRGYHMVLPVSFNCFGCLCLNKWSLQSAGFAAVKKNK